MRCSGIGGRVNVTYAVRVTEVTLFGMGVP